MQKLPAKQYGTNMNNDIDHCTLHSSAKNSHKLIDFQQVQSMGKVFNTLQKMDIHKRIESGKAGIASSGYTTLHKAT